MQSRPGDGVLCGSLRLIAYGKIKESSWLGNKGNHGCYQSICLCPVCLWIRGSSMLDQVWILCNEDDLELSPHVSLCLLRSNDSSDGVVVKGFM